MPLLSLIALADPEFVEQRFCLFEIVCIEAFGEPAIDRCEQIAGFGAPALVATQPGEAHAARSSHSLASCSSAMLRALR